MKDKLKKIDKQYVGLIIGLVAPVIGIYIFYLYNNFGMDFIQYITQSLQKGLTSKLLSLGLIANLVFFLPAINLDLYKISRGIILATFIYGALILIFKFTV